MDVLHEGISSTNSDGENALYPVSSGANPGLGNSRRASVRSARRSSPSWKRPNRLTIIFLVTSGSRGSHYSLVDNILSYTPNRLQTFINLTSNNGVKWTEISITANFNIYSRNACKFITKFIYSYYIKTHASQCLCRLGRTGRRYVARANAERAFHNNK